MGAAAATGGDADFGGGGAGLGGGIFVMQGGTLTVEGDLTIANNTITPGVAGGNDAGNGSAFGSGLFLQGNGNLTFQPGANETQTISNLIADQSGSGGSGADAGSWGLTKDGEGTLALNSANTYTGGTTMNAGTLGVGTGTALGSAEVAFSGGVVVLDDFTGASTMTVANDFSLNGTGLRAFNVLSGDSATLSGTIAGDAELLKSGAGTLILSTANTYTGGTTIEAGTLRLENDDAAGTGTITTQGSVIDYSNGINIANPIDLDSNTTQLQVSAGGAIQSGTISESNGPRPLEKIGAGGLVLSGTNTFTGPMTISSGGLATTNGSAIGDTTPVILNGASSGFFVIDSETIGSLSGSGLTRIAAGETLTVGGNDASTSFSGLIEDNGGPGNFTKIGGGTLNLTGDSTYTGPTIVDGGTLLVNGLIVSDVTVGNGATLGGSGEVGAVTVNGGTLAPGNSIGTLTVNGAFVLTPDAAYEVEVNAAGAGDKVIVNGTVNLTGATLRVLAANGELRASERVTRSSRMTAPIRLSDGSPTSPRISPSSIRA